MWLSFRLVPVRPSATAILATVVSALVATAAPGKGQPYAQASVDTTRATLGDPIQFRLHLVHDPESKPLLPDLDGLLSGTDIVVTPVGLSEGASGGVDSQRPGDPAVGDTVVRESVVNYLLKPYALGIQEIPGLSVGFVRASGDTLLRRTMPIQLEVVSVREEGDEGLRDIAPPKVILGGVPLWLVGILGAVVVVLFVFALMWILGRRRRGEAIPETAEPIDYVEEFRRIAAMGHLGRGEYKDYYSLLAETLRRFLEEVVEIDALEQTTTEISAALRQVEEEGTVREVVNFLGVADLVKFARFIPEIENAGRAPETAIAIVGGILSRQRELEELRRQEEAARAADERETMGDTPREAVVDGGRS